MRLKKLVIIAVLLFIAFIGVLYAALVSYDFNKFKPVIENAAYDATGRRLKIGDISFKIGLAPGITIKDISLQNAPWGQTPDMAKVKRLDLSIAILPLIYGNIHVKKISLISPDILIEAGPGGKSNLDFKTPQKTPQKTSKKETGFFFDKLVIKKGSIAYRDAESGKTYGLKINALRGSMTGEKVYRVSNLDIAVRDSLLAGSMEVNLKGKKPFISAKFSSPGLDLSPFLTNDGGNKAKKQRLFSPEPLPMDLLGKINAEVKFKAANLKPFMAKDVSFELDLKDGRLSLKPLKAAIAGGSLDGALDVEAKGKEAVVRANLKIKGISLEDIAQKANNVRVEGKLDIDIEASGRGESVSAIMGSLDGKANAVMGKGRIDNKYLGIFGHDISKSLIRLVNPAAKKETGADINCLVSRLDMKDGIARLDTFLFDTTLMSVTGKGRINLKTEGLDISLKPMPKEALGAGSYGLTIAELSKPFKLGGTLSSPALTIDPTATALTIGKILGGIALFGPAGVGAALVGERANENACLNVLKKVKKDPR